MAHERDNEFAQAWNNAEHQIAKYIAQVVGLKYREQLFVGDEEDLVGRYNIGAFYIPGGEEQDQGYQAGAEAWHTTGELVAIFVERARARAVAGALMNPANIPVEGGAENNMPNVLKVYMITHPEVRRERRPVANSSRPLLVSVVRMDFGVVYSVV